MQIAGYVAARVYPPPRRMCNGCIVRVTGHLLPLSAFCRFHPASRELTTVPHMASVNSGPFFIQPSANSTKGHALSSPSDLALHDSRTVPLPAQSVDVDHL